MSKKEPHHLRTLFISALSTIVASKEPWQLYQFIAKLIAKGFVQKSKVAQQKLAMLLCRSRKESIIAQVPRRLLIYLLAFLDYPPCIDCTEMFACCTESFYSKNKEGKTCLELIHDRATSYAQDTEERFLLEDTIMLLDKCWKQG